MQRPLQFLSTRCAALRCVLALLGAVTSCSDEVRPVVEVADFPATLPPSIDDLCTDRKEGESCADGRQCVAGRCLLSTCGDGVLAEGESCDDGNAAAGDGCSPSCNLEYTLCPTGEYVLAGSECHASRDQEPPAADGGASADCDVEGTFARIVVEGAAGQGKIKSDQSDRPAWWVMPGSALSFRVLLPRRTEPQDGRFIWRYSEANATGTRVWSYDRLASPSTANNTFTCPESPPGEFEVVCTLVAPGCPPESRSILIRCAAKPE